MMMNKKTTKVIGFLFFYGTLLLSVFSAVFASEAEYVRLRDAKKLNYTTKVLLEHNALPIMGVLKPLWRISLEETPVLYSLHQLRLGILGSSAVSPGINIKTFFKQTQGVDVQKFRAECKIANGHIELDFASVLNNLFADLTKIEVLMGPCPAGADSKVHDDGGR